MVSTCRKLKLDPYISINTKLTCKWIKDLSIMHGVLKVLGGKVGIYFH